MSKRNLVLALVIIGFLAIGGIDASNAKEGQGFCATEEGNLDSAVMRASQLAQSKSLKQPNPNLRFSSAIANLTNDVESTPLNGIFHTNPGASNVVQIIYKVDQPIIAFGDKGTMESFDRDGNPQSLSQGEWDIITFLAACVAEKYSPYDVDFTNDTSIQADYIQYFGGTSSDGAIRGVASFSQPVGFNFANEQTISLDEVRDPNYPDYVRAEVWCSVVSHELGHNLTLRHHSLNSELGTNNVIDGRTLNSSRSYNYDPGTVVYQPIMGSGLLANTPLVFYNNYSNLLTRQDDIAIIAGKLGLRPDDYGDSITTASKLSFTRNFVALDGILGARLLAFLNYESDRDYFYFDIPSSANHNFNLDISRSMAHRSGLYSAMVTLYNSSGQQVKQVKSHERFDSLNLNLNLAPGRYYVSVTNDEVNGSCGAYKLEARITPNYSGRLELSYNNKTYTDSQVIDLGQVQKGASSIKTLRLKNMGSNDITINSINARALPKGMKVLDSYQNTRLRPGHSLNLRVEVKQLQMDPELIGDLVINSTDTVLDKVKLRAEIYENVTWTSTTNITFSGLSPLKSSSTGWNAGAISTQVLAPGHDGWFEAKVDRIDHAKAFGFSSNNFSAGFDDFLYSVYLRKRHTEQIFQYNIVEDFPKMEFYNKSREGFNNLNREGSTRDGVIVRTTSFIPNIQDYKVGDIIRIERAGAKVKFKRNGMVITEWDVNPNESLKADFSLFDAGAVLLEPRLSFDEDPEPKDFEPARNATTVNPISPVFKLGFSESIKLGSFGYVRVVETLTGATVNEFHVNNSSLSIDSQDNSKLVIRGSNLKEGTQYHINIDYGVVTDLRGNVFEGFNSSQAWGFKTGVKISHQNQVNNYDVNNDGVVSPADVLLVINLINSGNIGKLSDYEHMRNGANVIYPDVSGDGFLSSTDALRVINYLNSGSNQDGAEGEGGPRYEWEAVSSASYFTINANTIKVNRTRRWSLAAGSEKFRLSNLRSKMSFETEAKDVRGYRYLVLSNNRNYWRSSRSSRFGFYMSGSYRSNQSSSYLYVIDGGSFRRVGMYSVGDKLKLEVDKFGNAKAYKNGSLIYSCRRKLASSYEYQLNLAAYTYLSSTEIYNLQWNMQ